MSGLFRLHWLSCPVLFLNCYGRIQLIVSCLLCAGVCTERVPGPQRTCRKVRARLEQHGCYQGGSIQVKKQETHARWALLFRSILEDISLCRVQFSQPGIGGDG